MEFNSWRPHFWRYLKSETTLPRGFLTLNNFRFMLQNVLRPPSWPKLPKRVFWKFFEKIFFSRNVLEWHNSARKLKKIEKKNFTLTNCSALCTRKTVRLKCEVLSKTMSNHHPLCPWMPNQCFRKSELPWISPEPVIEIRQKKTVLCSLFLILRPCYTSQSSFIDWYFFLTYMATQQDQLFYFNNSFLGCRDVQNVEKYYFYIYLSFSN